MHPKLSFSGFGSSPAKLGAATVDKPIVAEATPSAAAAAASAAAVAAETKAAVEAKAFAEAKAEAEENARHAAQVSQTRKTSCFETHLLVLMYPCVLDTKSGRSVHRCKWVLC